MVGICVSLTIYHGYKCTHKLAANPTTLNNEKVSLENIPPVQWSICKVFTFGSCGVPIGDFQPLFYDTEFYDDDDNDNDDECIFGRGVIPNHANSTQDFWNELEKRSENCAAASFVDAVDIWNESSWTWDRVFSSTDKMGSNTQQLFRCGYSIIWYHSRPQTDKH